MQPKDAEATNGDVCVNAECIKHASQYHRASMEPAIGDRFESPDGRTVHWTPWGIVVEAPVTEADMQRGMELAKERGWLKTP